MISHCVLLEQNRNIIVTYDYICFIKCVVIGWLLIVLGFGLRGQKGNSGKPGIKGAMGDKGSKGDCLGNVII